MGWDQFKSEQKPEEDNPRAQAQEALRKEWQQILKQHPLVKQWIGQVARAGSFTPGQSHAETAFKEGARGFAARILHMGGADE